jgi:PAS domain S-box-containing protein
MTREPEQTTILNVDDYEPGRYQRSRILRSAGFVVLEAGSGREALDITRAARPHILVLDVNLPDMSGLDVCRAIKSDPDLDHTLVLHLSASSVTPQNKIEGLAGGADSYLAEPIDPEELIANVQALLRLKRAEEQLRRTNVTLQAIVTSSPLAIIAVDLGGLVRQWNAAAERMFGWTEAEVVGRRIAVVPAGEEAAFDGRLRRAAAGEVASGFEARPVRRDGSEIDVSISLAPLRGEHRRIDGVLAIVEEITGRKRIEREVARLYQEAQEANRTKDEFLATLSHELRTPLNAILGWVRLLRSGELPEARRAHAVEVIERNTVAQVRLIEDILDVSRIVSGKLRLRSEPVDLAHAIETAADAIRPSAELAGVSLHVSIDGSAPSFTTIGDPQRLQQVVMNLLSNAVKFTPSGGRVDVQLRRVQERIEVVVHDTGVGIDPALLPFVFERFRQGDSSTARAHGGLGLGLAIARHLVEAHGGRVSASSAGAGQGSTFTLTLPLVPVAAVQGHAVADDLAAPVSLQALRVLIVEDDADSRALMEAVLAARGAVVHAAPSTAQALQVLERHALDIIVADIGLPHADGFTLLQRVREIPALAHLPAVAVTGFASEEDRLRVTAAGYAAHVPKPFDPEALVRTIARVAQRV